MEKINHRDRMKELKEKISSNKNLIYTTSRFGDDIAINRQERHIDTELNFQSNREQYFDNARSANTFTKEKANPWEIDDNRTDACGVMDYNDAVYGLEPETTVDGAAKSTIKLLSEKFIKGETTENAYKNFVFKNIKFRSPLFKYDIIGYISFVETVPDVIDSGKVDENNEIIYEPNENGDVVYVPEYRNGHILIYVKSYKLSAAPINSPRLGYLIQNVLKLNPEYLLDFLTVGRWNDDPIYLSMSEEDRNEKYIYKWDDIVCALKDVCAIEIDDREKGIIKGNQVVSDSDDDVEDETDPFARLRSNKDLTEDEIVMKNERRMARNMPLVKENGHINLFKCETWRAFKRNKEVKRYKFDRMISDLSSFYCEEILLLLKPKILKKLHKIMMTDPYILCYADKIRAHGLSYYLYQNSKSILYVPGSAYGDVFIPELDYDDMIRAKLKFSIDLRCREVPTSKPKKKINDPNCNSNFNYMSMADPIDFDYDVDEYSVLTDGKYDPFKASLAKLRMTQKDVEINEMKCKLYQELKMCLLLDRHNYMKESDLQLTINNFRKHEKVYHIAIEELIDENVIYQYEDKNTEKRFVYLSVVYTWQSGILDTFEYLICKQVENQTIMMKNYNSNIRDIYGDKIKVDELIKRYSKSDENISNFRTKGGFPLCSEQAEFFRTVVDRPFVSGNGKAGAGKTDVLKFIAELYKPYEILCSSWMVKVATRLNASFPDQSFSTDKLICTHSQLCQNQLRTKDAREEIAFKLKNMKDRDHMFDFKCRNKNFTSGIGIYFDKCIYEDIKILIIDEMSTQYEEILSKLLCGLVKCGKLEKIIMMGDVNQLPSLYGGNVFAQIFKGSYDYGYGVAFEHNHRVDKGSQLIVQNADLILAGKGDAIKFDGVHVKRIEFQGKYGDGIWIDNLKIVLERVLRTENIDEYDSHIIARMNSVKKLEDVYDQYYVKKDYPSETYKYNTYYKGRKVVFGKNDYYIGVYVNQIYIIYEIIDLPKSYKDPSDLSKESRIKSMIKAGKKLKHTSEHTLNKEFDRIVFLYPLKKGAVDFESMIILNWKWNFEIKRGCISTTHAFIGDQCDTVIIIMPYVSKFDTREIVYTMFTRAIRKIILIGERDGLTLAVSQTEPPRNSQFGLFLRSLTYKYDNVIGSSCIMFQNWVRKHEQDIMSYAKAFIDSNDMDYDPNCNYNSIVTSPLGSRSNSSTTIGIDDDDDNESSPPPLIPQSDKPQQVKPQVNTIKRLFSKMEEENNAKKNKKSKNIANKKSKNFHDAINVIEIDQEPIKKEVNEDDDDLFGDKKF